MHNEKLSKAIDEAKANYLEWLETTGAVPRNSSWDFELQSIIKNAVKSGAEIILASRHSQHEDREDETNANLAVLSALAALKWYQWKNKILVEISPDSGYKFTFPASDWTRIFDETLKRFRPDLYEQTKEMNLTQQLKFVEQSITPLNLPTPYQPESGEKGDR